MSVDPLAEVVTLLQPAARSSKLVECAGQWRTHREGTGEPFFCAVLEGHCRITVEGRPPMTLEAGDFLLIPALRDLVNESLDAPPEGVMTNSVSAQPGLLSHRRPAGLDSITRTDWALQLRFA